MLLILSVIGLALLAYCFYTFNKNKKNGINDSKVNKGAYIAIALILSGLNKHIFAFIWFIVLIYFSIAAFKAHKNHAFNLKKLAPIFVLFLLAAIFSPFESNNQKGDKIENTTSKAGVMSEANDVDSKSVNNSDKKANSSISESGEKSQGSDSDGNFIEAKVTNVVDGDTINVSIDGETKTVRLIGVDTPELSHPEKKVEYFAKEAADYTKTQLLDKTVYLEKGSSSTDKYGRLLFYLWLMKPGTSAASDQELGKNCFNSLLIENGYGKAYADSPDDKYGDFFKSREQIAKDNKYGLWGEGGEKIQPEPVKSAEEANKNIANNTESAVSEAKKVETHPADQTSNQAKPADQSKPAETTNKTQEGTKKITLNEDRNQTYIADTTTGKIKGNRKSKIYHKPGQSAYNMISVENVVYFDTEEEAQAQGYRPAKK